MLVLVIVLVALVSSTSNVEMQDHDHHLQKVSASLRRALAGSGGGGWEEGAEEDDDAVVCNIIEVQYFTKCNWATKFRNGIAADNAQACAQQMVSDSVTSGFLSFRNNKCVYSATCPESERASTTMQWTLYQYSCGSGSSDSSETEDVCTMELICESCDVDGQEISVGVMTFDECKNACVGDLNCFGIDYGKNGREGECYLNFDMTTSTSSHDDFDAYKKECMGSATVQGSDSTGTFDEVSDSGETEEDDDATVEGSDSTGTIGEGSDSIETEEDDDDATMEGSGSSGTGSGSSGTGSGSSGTGSGSGGTGSGSGGTGSGSSGTASDSGGSGGGGSWVGECEECEDDGTPLDDDDDDDRRILQGNDIHLGRLYFSKGYAPGSINGAQ